MDGTLALNSNAIATSMPKTKERKQQALTLMKSKLERAKLELIYAELEEAGINFERKYQTVEELKNDLKGSLNSLDYNKCLSIVKGAEDSLNTLTTELENSSTNAFTKLMTSDISKSIAKSLGISLAGRTALILAPTIGSKAAIATGLAGYGLYKTIKNRKQIIEINETNELNSILQEMEITKDANNNYLDTRFNEEMQTEVRDFLRRNNIKFEDTGYRSLRQVMYSLDNQKKKDLCTLLNTKYAKGIEIEKRVEKSRKKLNVVASSAAGISAGATLGIQLANTVNAVDPGLAAGVLNGSVLAAWINKIADQKWYAALTGGLGLIGSEVLQHIPVIGGAMEKVFAAENLASFATIGAVGGLAVSTVLGVTSVIKKIYDNSKNKKEIEKFLKADAEKYRNVDKEEFKKIQDNMKKPANLLESSIVDIVIGYLKEDNIVLEGNPITIIDIKKSIEKLPKEQRRKAQVLLKRINDNLNNDPSFIQNLKKAGRISMALVTSGLAAMSVYDIVSGGSFLPELSQKLFPVNNIHTPVDVPPSLDTKLDPNNPNDAAVIDENTEILDEFSDDKYMVEDNGQNWIEYGYNYGVENPGLAGLGAEQRLVDTGLSMNALEKILGFFGIKLRHDMVPNIPEITERLNQLSPEKLYEFYRTFNTLEGDNSPMYQAVKQVLGYNNMLEKASSYINGFERTQKLHDLINNVSNGISTGAIPLSVGLTAIGLTEKQDTSNKYDINEEEINQKVK